MSDQEQSTGGLMLAQEDAAVATTRPVRAFTPVISDKAIMDTARFEHLGRVALVMARAGLMPQSLTHVKEGTGDNAPLVPLSMEVVQARALMIANQADLWGADPISVAQCTSIVHGKLMYEGKLVHAVISAILGVDLVYEFGRYDVAKRDIVGKYETDPDTGAKVWVGEMPTSVDDQALGVRVSGTLPGEKMPRRIAGSVGMWHTGSRGPWQKATAWVRQLRYMGAREWCRAHKPALLLGIVTDDEVEEYTLAREVGAIGPSTAPTLHAEFSDPRKAELIEGPAKPKRAGKKAESEQAPAASAPEAAQELQESPEKAETVSGDVVDAEVITEGHAAPDEVYLHAEFPALEDGRRVTFKNGERFSSVKEQGALKVYGQHAPEAAPPAQDEPEVETEVEPEGDAEEDDAEDGLPPELGAYVGTIEKAGTWVDVKKAMQAFYTTEYFKALSPEQQNQIRGNTWDVVQEGKYPDKPDQAADVSAFRLWIEWIEDPEAIQGTLRVLEGEPAFAQKPDDFKNAIRNATEVRLRALQLSQG